MFPNVMRTRMSKAYNLFKNMSKLNGLNEYTTCRIEKELKSVHSSLELVTKP